MILQSKLFIVGDVLLLLAAGRGKGTGAWNHLSKKFIVLVLALVQGYLIVLYNKLSVFLSWSHLADCVNEVNSKAVTAGFRRQD